MVMESRCKVCSACRFVRARRAHAALYRVRQKKALTRAQGTDVHRPCVFAGDARGRAARGHNDGKRRGTLGVCSERVLHTTPECGREAKRWIARHVLRYDGLMEGTASRQKHHGAPMAGHGVSEGHPACQRWLRHKDADAGRVLLRVLLCGLGLLASVMPALSADPPRSKVATALRAASSCERSLTNASQALQLLPDAVSECERLKRTPGATALQVNGIGCWSDLDTAEQELQAAYGPFSTLRQGGRASDVGLHTENAQRFLERARRCIAQVPDVATRPDVPAPPRAEGPQTGDSWSQGGVTVIRPGGARGTQQNHADNCQRLEDEVFCPGGRAGIERMVRCSRDGDGRWPKECPTVFQAEADRRAAMPYDRCRFNPQLTECLVELPKRQPPRVPPPPPGPALQAGLEQICDLRKLAAYAFGGYYDQRPVARLRVTNGNAPDTYLLLLSGMQPRLGGSTNLADAATALFNVQGLDSYRMAVMDALEGVPHGSTLILVGHSQGGMEAQNMVHNLVERWGFKVPQVITFGAPVSTWKQAGTSYLHLREATDPVPALDRMYDLTAVRLFRATRKLSVIPWDPDGAHLVYDKPVSGLQNMPLPQVRGLRSACIEVDMRSLVRKTAPDYFTRMFTRPVNHEFRGATPRNPDAGFNNCVWVSLAQDRFWREGLPYYAMCEASPLPDADLEAVLVRHFGGLHLDDGLGPTSLEAVQRHSQGRPATTHRAELERALLRTGTRPDGRIVSTGGIVFVRMPGEKVGHAFNVRLKVNGTIEYADAQLPLEPASHFRTGVEVRYYRTF